MPSPMIWCSRYANGSPRDLVLHKLPNGCARTPRMGTPWSGAADRPLLEPPGFMMLNYGRRTPVATIVAHVAYGTIVGGFISLAA